MSNPGFRIKTNFTRPPAELVQSFAGLPVANIGDNMNRLSCMNSRIIPLNQAPLIGCAFTVKVRAGDNLLFHKAIDLAQPGDVIVIDAQGEHSYSIFGELMVQWCRKRGLNGLVADGCIRDSDYMRRLTDFPVYAVGINPNGPLKEGGGEINFPIMCGGIVVKPGDIIVGDADGVVVIDSVDAPEIARKAKSQNEKENQIMEGIEHLKWDRAWVDAVLKAKGCEFVD
ncbi:MAG: RraA family protein [Deltaproteobacteria bacterium]|jgi:regulator of RNase E activity RraA|nr:RraA family protein [Deltaproteobacteria bacterium]